MNTGVLIVANICDIFKDFVCFLFSFFNQYTGISNNTVIAWSPV